jgi:hypothetical protein
MRLGRCATLRDPKQSRTVRSVMRWYGALVLALASCVVVSRSAAAEPVRVAFVDPDPELERAVRVALSAWGTRVLEVRLAGPGSTMPGSAERARALAVRHGALAVVWISKSEDGHALWMYDMSEDRVVARRLTAPPPFDDATAASVALAVKTLLRQSAVPPLAERAVVPPSMRWLSAEVFGGVRPMATEPGTTEARFGAGVTAWPRFALDPLVLGIGAEVISGPGVRVRDVTFAGRWTETALLLGPILRLRTLADFDVSFEPGFGVGIAHVSGKVAVPVENVSLTRVNGLGSLRAGAGYQPSNSFRVGVGFGVARPLRTQAYLVRGRPVLDAKALNFDAILAIEAGLF